MTTYNENSDNISSFQYENDLLDIKEESCIPCKSELSKSNVKLSSEKEGESSLNKTEGELNQLYSAFEGLHFIISDIWTKFENRPKFTLKSSEIGKNVQKLNLQKCW